jgi:peptide/nickel transport system ATP-binding protein
MCAGHLVEMAPRKELFANPGHPYTRALLSAVPEPNLKQHLDFSTFSREGVSDPGAWPEPFRLEPGAPSAMEQVASNHLVRVSA